MKTKTILLMGMALGIVVVPPALAAIAAQAPTDLALGGVVDKQEGAADPAAVFALVTRFREILAGFPADAAQQDIEAAVLFEADQSGQPQNVVLAALEQVRIGQARLASNALTTILIAQRRAAGQGTGAVSGEAALDLFGEDTGPPVVLGGGVDSNYI